MQTAIHGKKAELHGLWVRTVKKQKEHGLEQSPELIDYSTFLSLDDDKCLAKLKEIHASLSDRQTERDSLKESLVADEQLLADLVAMTATANQEAESIRRKALADQKKERDRRKGYDEFLANLENDRAKVAKLRHDKAELEESIDSARQLYVDQYSENEDTIRKRQAELDKNSAELAAAIETIPFLKYELEEFVARNTRLLEEAKQRRQ